MLATVVLLVSEAVEWLRRWRAKMLCFRLIERHLSQSSVILRRLCTPCRALHGNHCVSDVSLPSNRCLGDVSSTCVLWTHGDQQLAVTQSLCKVSLADGWTSFNDRLSSSSSAVEESQVADAGNACNGDIDLLFAMSRSTAVNSVLADHIQLKDVVRLVAWKAEDQPGANDKLIAASCRRVDFHSLLRSFLAGVGLTHDGLHVDSFTTVELCGKTPSSHTDVKHLSRPLNTVTSAAAGQRRSAVRAKPPNVLVYCGKKDSGRQFAGIKSVLSQCINTDQYVIYQLKHELVATTPWQDNTALLVVASEKVYDGVDRAFLQYFLNGGLLMSFGSSLDSLIVERAERTPGVTSQLGLVTVCWGDGGGKVSAIGTKYCYAGSCEARLADVLVSALAHDERTQAPVIVEVLHRPSAGVAVLSQAHLDKDAVELAISPEVFTLLKQSNAARFTLLTSLCTRLGLDCDKPVAPPLTPVCLLAPSETCKSSFLESVRPRFQDGCRLVSHDVTLKFASHRADSASDDTSTTLTVLTDCTSPDHSFNESTYRRHLTSRLLGNVVLYSDVVTSTIHLLEPLMFACPRDVGLIAIARRQLAGQGRGGNAWLSPDGCAMFSLHVRIDVSSHLGQRVSFIQHLVSLAVVLAVRQKPHCEDVDLRIKWPNDIYFGRGMKLGGVIVKSSVMRDVIHVNIGCGVNVTNKDPTVCINDLVRRASDLETGSRSRPEPFRVEELIARSLSVLEQLIEKFEADDQRQVVIDDYYKYWLHSDAVVRVAVEGSDAMLEGRVTGLDEFGFIQVTLTDGSTVSVQPDGNSFDMMHNLILPKS